MTSSFRAGRSVTILDVAKESNVSKSTVSLVLQGSELISVQTSERVREAAIKLGYVYNRRAADLRRQSSKTIGVLINDLRNPFFAEILIGLEKNLVEAGFDVFMAHTNESVDQQNRVLAAMREQGAAGIAICPAMGTPLSLIKTIDSWGIPCIVIVRTLGIGNYDFAGAANTKAVKLATDYLLSQGAERPAFIGGLDSAVLEQRLDGYKLALQEKNIPVEESLIYRSPPTLEGGYNAMLKLLESKTPSTAAVCYNDLTAFGALSALGEKGLRAGIDFKLMGYDNVLAAAHSNPPLTTVDINAEMIGFQAANLLRARIENPELAQQEYMQEPSLVIRQSA